MPKIQKIIAREILDSRGEPTIEAKIFLDNGLEEIASVPAGASKGENEAVEIRDYNQSRFNGRGVLSACFNIEKIISPALKNFEITKLKEIDKKLIELDGTDNKSKLGANSILACSLVCAKAGAKSTNLPTFKYLRKIFDLKIKNYQFPLPLFNLINGGRHGFSNLDFQEFFVIFRKREKISKIIQRAVEFYSLLKKIVQKEIGIFGVGDEGGIVTPFKNNKEAIEILIKTSKKIGYRFDKEINFGLDCAASEFYHQKENVYYFEKRKIKTENLIKIYKDLVKRYHLILLEDPLNEKDFLNWSKLKKNLLKIKKDFILVGDDLFVTNLKRLKRGIEFDSANGIIIKPNQIGTISETIECIKLAKKAKHKVIISHRSGETNETFIADLALAVNADFIKAGAPNRGERIVKYNRLMEIEEILERNL